MEGLIGVMNRQSFTISKSHYITRLQLVLIEIDQPPHSRTT